MRRIAQVSLGDDDGILWHGGPVGEMAERRKGEGG